MTSNAASSASQHNAGPFKFTHAQLERDGVIVESEVPENRRNNIYFIFTSPIPGTFIIALHYKGLFVLFVLFFFLFLVYFSSPLVSLLTLISLTRS